VNQPIENERLHFGVIVCSCRRSRHTNQLFTFRSLAAKYHFDNYNSLTLGVVHDCQYFPKRTNCTLRGEIRGCLSFFLFENQHNVTDRRAAA